MTSNLLLTPRREPERSALRERRLRRYAFRYQSRVRDCAMRHPHLADLALSFPALLFALAVPRRHVDLEPAIACVIAGRPLAAAAAAAGIPTWLRKLPPEAFVQPIGPLPDGELFRRQIANHLPRSPKLMPRWLQLVADMAAIAHDAASVWIAREYLRTPRAQSLDRIRLVGLWIWFSGQAGCYGRELVEQPWTPDMNLDTAVAAASAWKTIVSLHTELAGGSVRDAWISPGRVGDYEFRPLNDIAGITDESVVMRNCVLTYGRKLSHNASRLWSVRRGVDRVATLEVGVRRGDPLLNVVQLNGPGNAPVSRELWWAARCWLHMNDLLQVETGFLTWDQPPLDVGTWRALWRPYWLAKRRFPHWLPLRPSRGMLFEL